MEQKTEASVGIMDSQSVCWRNNRFFNGVDDNKKYKGIKRHVAKVFLPQAGGKLYYQFIEK